MRRRPHQAGFTLIEILLAFAILTFIVGTLWGTFSRTASTKRQLEAAQDRLHTARVALMRMTREIEMAYLSRDPISAASLEKRTLFVGSSHPDIDELMFSWFGRQRMRADVAEGDTSMVRYYAERDPDEPGQTNIMRRETRRLDYRAPASMPGEAYILCPNVTRLKFSYFDAKKREWREEWSTVGADTTPYLPTHIRISLTVIDERGKEVTYTSAARIQMTEMVEYKGAT